MNSFHFKKKIKKNQLLLPRASHSNNEKSKKLICLRFGVDQECQIALLKC